jgi:diaminohydroxyphosphoribosylaminopyrimidine deaminase / 5-amino-6-(5-phosphoribosylamino)uracil reductase
MTVAAAATPRVDPAEDARFMHMALALGRRGLGRTWPNPSVGAVVVRPGPGGPIVVGRGWTQPGGRPHAEIEALGRAGSASRGATVYTSLEPCSHHGKTPPCADAIATAGVARVVSALEDPNPEVGGAGHARLRAAGVAVEIGLGAQEARRVHAGHIRRVAEGRPHVLLKIAVSADGKAGLADRRPAAITGEEARGRVHMLRAASDAVLVGIGTALADDPQLTCRLPGMSDRSPVRVVLDTRLQLPPTGKLAATAADTPLWVIAGDTADAGQGEALRAQAVEVLQSEVRAGRIDVAGALRLLAGRGITRVLVEGGPRVAAAFLAADLVDEAVLLRGPVTIGPDGIDALDALPLAALAASPRLRSRGAEAIGPDTIETFERSD